MKKRIAVLIALIIGIVFLFIFWPNAPYITIEGERIPEGTGQAEAAPQAETLYTEPLDSPLTITLSETGHFHTQDFSVEITASHPDARIFYTFDGSVPSAESPVYSAPLQFRAGRSMRAHSLRAVAVYGDAVSDLLTHTYFVGRDVLNRFDTLVFSLSSDPVGLFDHHLGIFVPGIIREEYILANPRARINPPSPANFNQRGMEAERAASLEVFTPQGERVIFQEAGIRVHGGWSRAEEQKSIRLIARRDYSPDTNRFYFDFFPEDVVRDGSDTPLARYQTLILRNGGNDRNFGMLRHEVASVLVRNAGFAAVSPVRPVAVFLNGEYYGFAWLQVRMNDHYLRDLFGAPAREFDNVGMGERWVQADDPQARADINFMNDFANENLLDDAVFSELEAIVDIDNLLFYYAFQIFMGNEDWPHNNLRRWRYTGEQVPSLSPELDGRWRYIFFDLDWTLGLYGDDFTKPTFQRVLEGNSPRSPLLKNILTRQDMANRFTMIMCDIAANVVNERLVQNVLEDLYGAAEREITYALAAGRYAHWVGIHSVQNNHDNMLAFARQRHEVIFESMVRFFGFGEDMYRVYVLGGEAVIGTQRGTSAQYFLHLEVPVTPILAESAEFYHWLLNGERVYDETIVVSLADAVDGTVELTLITR
ncbi:MAG: CotH kinase family protein [Defluviitaleaceae bacterium]|nr:CotH kinase family protein [Defluviitaleaceae bacterium]